MMWRHVIRFFVCNRKFLGISYYMINTIYISGEGRYGSQRKIKIIRL